MSKQQERFEAMRSETTEKILFSATKLFAKKTFFKTTIQDIADDAGISKGLAYRYFSSKEEIMNKLIDLSVPSLNAIADLFLQKGNEKEILITVTKGLLSNLIEDPSATEGFLLLSQIDSFSKNELDPDLKKQYETSLKKLIDSLSSLIASGQENGYFSQGEPRELAFFYYSVYQGIAFTSRTFKAEYIYPSVDQFLSFLIKE
ncbi:TetR/AcrR family transcriptional regulator [Shimazuella kribbensis]|uniref:TetR/AcrR family transcriptional regulator n=1 Tax=Shimazuella kribbensis TaxID=139808 RepID=UPI00042A78EA|nr:TetR/AcrR family transcriptional regulator [Shimazuella kribbensis]